MTACVDSTLALSAVLKLNNKHLERIEAIHPKEG